MEELSKVYQEKRDELESFDDNVNSLIGEKDNLAIKTREKKLELKKAEVSTSFSFNTIHFM